jgi:PAS domain S-box-containing protein
MGAPEPLDAHVSQRERQLALLVDAVSDYAIFLLDPNGVVASWNRGAERIKGYRADEIIGQHFSQFYTEPDRAIDHPQEELEIAVREGRFEEEGWRVRKDGTQFWANVVITAIRDADGSLIGFGKVTRDLTARRLSEEQLREAVADLQQFRTMVSGVRDYAIYTLDPGGYVATWNVGAERIKGLTPEEAVGRHFSDFHTPEDRAAGHPAETLEIAAREGRYEEEGWRMRASGERFWAGVVLTAIRNDDGALMGYAKVTRDLTERRQAQQDLETFASSAAHDLQEPLRTVAGFVDLLGRRHGGALPDEAREYLGHIDASVERMSRLIADLLAYSRSGVRPFERVAVPLADAAQSVVDGLGGAVAERAADVRLDVPPGLAIDGDRAAVTAVLQNLVSNAVKFADPEAPRVAVAARRVGADVRIEVRDNGPGIPEDKQATVFQPFVQLQVGAGGTGLGLSICRRIVDRHGGDIGVASRPGEETLVWVRLPAAD